MTLCRFGREMVTAAYQGMCRSSFNSALIVGTLESETVASVLKVVGLPCTSQMFLFGALAGGCRESMGAVVDKLDVLDLKNDYKTPYQVMRFVLTFFASLKVAEYICHEFNIPVSLTNTVVVLELVECGLGKGIDVAFEVRNET